MRDTASMIWFSFSLNEPGMRGVLQMLGLPSSTLPVAGVSRSAVESSHWSSFRTDIFSTDTLSFDGHVTEAATQVGAGWWSAGRTLHAPLTLLTEEGIGETGPGCSSCSISMVGL